jgi:ABC-type antimicrobial peptide transport system ATPase subunit
MGLAGKAAARPGDLNHDECQRLAVARAVAGRPEIILADEPVGWMGPEAAARVLRLLLQLNQLPPPKSRNRLLKLMHLLPRLELLLRVSVALALRLVCQ